MKVGQLYYSTLYKGQQPLELLSSYETSYFDGRVRKILLRRKKANNALGYQILLRISTCQIDNCSLTAV